MEKDLLEMAEITQNGEGAKIDDLVIEADKIISGRLLLARMPTGEQGKVLTGQGPGVDPAFLPGGSGSGDMLKGVYDPDGDGIIALAQIDPNRHHYHQQPPGCCRWYNIWQDGKGV